MHCNVFRRKITFRVPNMNFWRSTVPPVPEPDFDFEFCVSPVPDRDVFLISHFRLNFKSFVATNRSRLQNRNGIFLPQNATGHGCLDKDTFRENLQNQIPICHHGIQFQILNSNSEFEFEIQIKQLNSKIRFQYSKSELKFKLETQKIRNSN